MKTRFLPKEQEELREPELEQQMEAQVQEHTTKLLPLIQR